MSYKRQTSKKKITALMSSYALVRLKRIGKRDDTDITLASLREYISKIQQFAKMYGK